MTVKEFLNSVREARFDQARCTEKLRQIREQTQNVTANLSGMPRGGGDVHHDSALAALADREAELDAAKARAIRLETAVESFIDGLSAPEFRILMKLRFCDGLSWSQLQQSLPCYGLYFSDSTVFRIYRIAFREAKQKWNNEPEWSERFDYRNSQNEGL